MGEDALAGLRAVGDIYGVAGALEKLAQVELRSANAEVACAHLRESIELSRSIGDNQSLVSTLGVAAAIAYARGDPFVSTRLWDAHRSLCEAHGFDGELEPWLDEVRTATRAAASHPAAADSELDLDAAMELALEAVAT